MQDAVVRLADVDDVMPDAEVVYELIGRRDIRLLAVRHEHADHAVAAQRLDAERRDDGAVLAAGNADDGVAVRPVLGEIAEDPFDTVGADFLYIKHLDPSRSIFLNIINQTEEKGKGVGAFCCVWSLECGVWSCGVG